MHEHDERPDWASHPHRRESAASPAAALTRSGSTSAPGPRGTGPVGRLSPTAVMALQRSAGNAAVARMLGQEQHEHGAGCGHQLAHQVHHNAGEAPAGRAPSVGHSDATEQRAPAAVVQRARTKRNATTAGLSNQASGQPPAKRQTRSAGKPAPDLSKPVLDFDSSYDGVNDQKFRSSQALGFTQSATLTKPASAPLATATYYDYRQEVKDSWVSIYEAPSQFKQQTSAASAANWKQDGPYRPPYTNAVIDNTANSIKFNDDPGFSTDRKIPSDNWLESYTVSFRWKVKLKPKYGGRGEWTSPAVTHTLTSAFDQAHPDQPQPVTHQAAGAQQWTPTLP